MSYRAEIQQVAELLVCPHCSHSLLLFLSPSQSQQLTRERGEDCHFVKSGLRYK